MALDTATALVVSAAAAGVYLLSWGLRSAIRRLQEHSSVMKGVAAEAAALRAEMARNRETLERAASIFSGECAELRNGLETWREQTDRIVRLGEECVRTGQMLQAIRREQEKYPFGRPVSAGVPAQNSPEMADLEYRIQQTMKEHGVTRHEAMMMLNPANQWSPWDGFGEWDQR